MNNLLKTMFAQSRTGQQKNPAVLRSHTQYSAISEKIKNVLSKAMLVAMLLIFALEAHVNAQVTNGTPATTGYLIQWEQANTIPYTLNNSLIYQDASSTPIANYIGIGTTTPIGQLDVEMSSASTAADVTNALFNTTITSGGSASINGLSMACVNNGTGNTYGVYCAADISGINSTSWGVNGVANIIGTGVTGATIIGVYGNYNLGGNSNLTNTYWAGYFNGPAGCTANAWTLSDMNLKNNIQPLTGALDNLMKLQPKTYTFKVNDYPGINFDQAPQMGLLAQDVEKIYPNLVKQAGLPEQKDAKGNLINKAYSFKMMNYTGLIPVVISSVQEQQTEIQQLQNTVSDLQDKYNTLLAEMSQLQNNQGSQLNNQQPSLGQNVPNPFNQSTVINYYLPANMPNASITIHSIAGVAVQSFTITSPGTGHVSVSAGTLAPGTYQYDMTVNGKIIDSKKMVIIGE